jgi:hypothetical protein
MRNIFGGEHDFEDEGLTTLMTGVRYGDTDYDNFSDFTGIPSESADFIAALQSNMNRGSGHMEITFNGAALSVKVNGALVYSDDDANLSLGQFLLQSHWGSGVVFTEMDVQ